MFYIFKSGGYVCVCVEQNKKIKMSLWDVGRCDGYFTDVWRFSVMTGSWTEEA